MRVDAFDFELPENRIALRPCDPREDARLLHVRKNGLANKHVADLPGLLSPGDVLVLNDTKVIPARLFGVRVGRGETEPKIEATLHLRKGATQWKAFAKPGRKLQVGDRIRFAGEGELLEAIVEEKCEGGEIALAFDIAPDQFETRLATIGVLPLPPYIASRRAIDEKDVADYQTAYADAPGAVAAPTAGLHLTAALLEKIRALGVTIVTVTLHVGAGTFLPVKADETEDHVMHAEWGEVSDRAADTINAAKAAGGRLIAGGTTSLRLIESAAREDGSVVPFLGETDIFITPGYRFRAVDCLFTNFHLPRSTLFMLVSAFCGLERMKVAYAHAIKTGYRFYSYGDASFLECRK